MQKLIDWYIVYICFILCSTNYKLAGKCWISQDISIIVMIDQAHSYLTLIIDTYLHVLISYHPHYQYISSS